MAATVLLVEDEHKLRELVRSYLERAGFTVLSTGSGAEATAPGLRMSIREHRTTVRNTPCVLRPSGCEAGSSV